MWDSEQTGPVWKEMVRAKVVDLEQAVWRRKMAAKPKLDSYRLFKTKLEYEPYLDLTDSVARKAMTRIRSGTSELRVESGRFESRVRADLVGGWRRLRREERRCVLCFTEVEDGVHLMLRCPAYSILREGLLGSLVGLGIRDQEVAEYAVQTRVG